jgi:Winged helix DNA-binding domain
VIQSSSSIVQQRLYNQLIAGRVCRSPAEVVGVLGAVQAQDFLGALWAIGLRVKAATESDVEQSIADRQIVRTWPMRGTLHFVLSADVRWMLELLTPRIVARWAARTRQLELDGKELVRNAKTIGHALRGNKQIPRGAVYRLLESAGISTKGQRGLHILGLLAMQGLVCFGTRADKQQRFALLDEWVPNAK